MTNKEKLIKTVANLKELHSEGSLHTKKRKAAHKALISELDPLLDALGAKK